MLYLYYENFMEIAERSKAQSVIILYVDLT